MPATNPGTTNLVSWWSMDEASGTRADAHGSNDLTDNNSVGTSTAKVGANAADLTPGSSHWLDNSSSDFATGFGSFSWSGWFKADSVTGYKVLVGKDVSGTRDYYIAVGLTTGRITVGHFSGGSHVDSTVISTGTWYHLVVTWEDTGSATVLGTSINGGTFQTTSTLRRSVGGSGASLGRRDYVGFHQYYDGALDEWAFWSDVLTQDEADWLYDSGSGRSYSDVSGGGSSPVAAIVEQHGVYLRRPGVVTPDRRILDATGRPIRRVAA